MGRCSCRSALVRATDDDDARSRAAELGKAREHSYPNADGELVTWRFAHVDDVQKMSDELAHGGEVFSRMFWGDLGETSPDEAP